MLITLRNLKVRAEVLSEVIGCFCGHNASVVKAVQEGNGEGVCLVIDGLDEYQPEDKEGSLVYKLLHKTVLPKAMIIVSSRPEASPLI